MSSKLHLLSATSGEAEVPGGQDTCSRPGASRQGSQERNQGHLFCAHDCDCLSSSFLFLAYVDTCSGQIHPGGRVWGGGRRCQPQPPLGEGSFGSCEVGEALWGRAMALGTWGIVLGLEPVSVLGWELRGQRYPSHCKKIHPLWGLIFCVSQRAKVCLEGEGLGTS